jgi:replicative DNA helicase
MSTAELSFTQIEAMVRGAASAPRVRPDGRPYRLVKPLALAADSLVAFAEQPERRALLNIFEIDTQTMGIGPGELAYLTGFSHSGKTQVVLNALLAQRDRRTVIFTADEPASLVLAKLVSLSRGINGRTLIEGIQNGDRQLRDTVYEVASQDWPNLLVVDGSLGFEDMTIGYEEASEYWGEVPQIVVVDYLGLIRGGNAEDQASSIVTNSRALKAWTMDHDVPVLCMHQGTRSGSGRGQAATLADAAAYGGEAEAIFLVNVRRKKTAILAEIRDLQQKQMSGSRFSREMEDRLMMLEADLPRHENTVTVQLLKSKRPGSRLTHPDGIDYHLDPDTGRIKPLPKPYVAPVQEEFEDF